MLKREPEPNRRELLARWVAGGHEILLPGTLRLEHKIKAENVELSPTKAPCEPVFRVRVSACRSVT
jgi:hypothetical protein